MKDCPLTTTLLQLEITGTMYQGASGWVEFTHAHMHSHVTYGLLENGVEQHVWTVQSIGFLVNISTSQLPRDTLP